MENEMNENLDVKKQKDENKRGAVLVSDRQKKHKKRIGLLILLLLFTGVMLGTSTYAWFTANKTVNVNKITVNVAAQNGIQISVDGTTWKSIIQTADIQGAIAKYTAAKNQVPAAVEPVSTVGEMDTDGLMKMYYGVVDTNDDGNYILTATKSTETNGSEGKFIAFDLFFKVDQDTETYLTSTSGVVAEGDDSGIKNASRMAFIVLGNTTAGDTVANIQALNAGTTAPVNIWEPNIDVHKAAAVAHARDTYGITTQEAGATQIAYDGIKADITKENNVLVGKANATDNATYFGNTTMKYSTNETFADRFAFLSLKSGITKVRIYMWIEGQDVDCENNASGGSITYNLQITTEAA